MEEKRTHERTSVDLKVIYMGDSMSYSRGRVNNISKGGMFIQTDLPQDHGTYILASLDVDNLGKIVWAQGRVIRAMNHGMAIEFTRIDERGIDAIIANWGMPV
jgi:hypothetical protein